MKTKTKKIKTKSKKSKIIKSIIVWALVLGFLGWFAALRLDANTNTEGYDYVIPFESRKISEYRPASGKVVLQDIESVSSDVAQKIKKVYCKIGDTVNEGDVLCEFESEDLDDEIERIEKYLNERKAAENLTDNNSQSSAEYLRQSAELAVESAKMALDSANKAYTDTYAKYSDYFGRCYSTEDPAEAEIYKNMYEAYQEQLEPCNDVIRSAKKDYDEALEALNKFNEQKKESDYEKSLVKSGIEEYEKQLSKLKEQKEHLVVTAPRSGIIAESYASEGGFSLDGCLFRIGSLGTYKIEAYVNSADILDIKPGMEASVKTILSGADEIEAKVSKVSDMFSQANDGYAVELEITDKSYMEKLRHNANATVKIYSLNLGKVPSVQYDAVDEDENGNKFVYKAVKRGGDYITEKVPVDVVYEGNFYVQVNSSELNEGDLIAGNASNHSSGDKLKLKGMAG